MAQILRPNSDIDIGDWEGVPSGDSNILWNKIDEVTHDSDTTYITTNINNATCEVGLSAGSTPVSGTRTLRVVARIITFEKERLDLNVRLLEGGSLVQEFGIPNLGSSYTIYAFTVTNSITDYSDLSVELITQAGGVGQYRVTQIEFEIPDPEEDPSHKINSKLFSDTIKINQVLTTNIVKVNNVTI